MTDFAIHIRGMMPDVPDSELEVRISLLKARDYSLRVRTQTDSPVASELAHQAYEVAGATVFQSGPSIGQLERILEFCRSTVKAAMQADNLDIGVAA